MPLLLFILFAVFAVGCEQKPEVRHYTETIITAADPVMPPFMAGANNDPHAGLGIDVGVGVGMGGVDEGRNGMNEAMATSGTDMAKAPMMPTANEALKSKLTWDIPKGWVQQGASPMRLATLRIESDPKVIDCSIVSLPGGAGGLQANLKRWLGQIKVDINDAELQDFIKTSKNNIYDFTQLQKNADASTPSMIAAVLDLDGASVFVKMSGSIHALKQHQSGFQALVKSIKLK